MVNGVVVSRNGAGYWWMVVGFVNDQLRTIYKQRPGASRRNHMSDTEKYFAEING